MSTFTPDPTAATLSFTGSNPSSTTFYSRVANAVTAVLGLTGGTLSRTSFMSYVTDAVSAVLSFTAELNRYRQRFTRAVMQAVHRAANW